MNKVYAFPGQGSQSIGMGSHLFNKFPKVVTEANDILGYCVKDLCLNNPNQMLNQTKFTQPALFVVNYLSFLNKISQGEEADIFVGHSLGELNALLAAEVFPFDIGLKLVQKRGDLMSKAQGGAMAAILGMESNKIEKTINENSLFDIDIANFNAPIQTVISGKSKAIEQAKSIFINSGAKRYIILPVSGAFHSRFMKSISEDFKNFASQFSFSNPCKKVIANVNALPYSKNIVDTLTKQIYSPVLWIDTIKNIIADYGRDTKFDELGPGTVLTGLIKKVLQSV